MSCSELTERQGTSTVSSLFNDHQSDAPNFFIQTQLRCNAKCLLTLETRNVSRFNKRWSVFNLKSRPYWDLASEMWRSFFITCHYGYVITCTMASQITSLTIVYSTVYSGAYQIKHQSTASLAFVRGIHRWPVNSPQKGPVTRKIFPFGDVIMFGEKISWDIRYIENSLCFTV